MIFVDSVMFFKSFDNFSPSICCQGLFPVFTKRLQLLLKSAVAEEAARQALGAGPGV